MDAKNEATRKGIKANSIVINRGLVMVPGEPGRYPEMICGLKCYLTSNELPNDYAFAVCHNPNIEPVQQWIPVTERLPNICESVLVCFDFMGGKAIKVSDRYGKNGMLWSGLETMGVIVTHWMPLPQPPKGE